MITVHDSIEKLPFGTSRRTVLTVGTFDGLHLGHRAILRQVESAARKHDAEAVLVTFDPHPRHIVSGKPEPALLTTRDEKIALLESCFSGTVVIVPFNATVQAMSARDFVEKILVKKFAPIHMVIGYDHAFGRNRGGTTGDLQVMGNELGFSVDVVEPFLFNGKPISSSRIRTALAEGRMEYAAELLGAPYGLQGTVEHGIGKGHDLGYPTANVRVLSEKLAPREGVYSCTVKIDSELHSGVLFIGRNYLNPAGEQTNVTIEAHLFNFNRDIYTTRLWLYPSRFLRENRRFDSTTELVAQIGRDVELALTMHNDTRYTIKE